MVSIKLFACLALVAVSSTARAATDLPLAPDSYEHVTFNGVTPSAYSLEGAAMRIDVRRSASFLLKPFEQVHSVRVVTLQWHSDGPPLTGDEATERSRGGDDARLKIGLLLAGPDPLLPLLAPHWVKQVRDELYQSTDHALVLVAGAVAAPGTRWVSPGSDSIEMQAIDSVPLQGGTWYTSTTTFPKPLKVVGIWIMADGDATSSTFSSWLRQITLN